jgi:signal recognition particle subunit SRP54
MKTAINCPIKFLGTGEKPNQFEVFQAERLANRILDMGDVVGLVEKAMQVSQDESMEKLAKNFQKDQFTLEDMSQQLQKMLSMGGIMSFMKLLPGFSRFKDQMTEGKLDDRLVRRQVAIIQSMTLREKKDPKILNASRRRRIALGCGQSVADVNRLLKQFEQMRQMMRQFKDEKKIMRGGGLRSLFRG